MFNDQIIQSIIDAKHKKSSFYYHKMQNALIEENNNRAAYYLALYDLSISLENLYRSLNNTDNAINSLRNNPKYIETIKILGEQE